jgi:hypothetical protein
MATHDLMYVAVVVPGMGYVLSITWLSSGISARPGLVLEGILEWFRVYAVTALGRVSRIHRHIPFRRHWTALLV